MVVLPATRVTSVSNPPCTNTCILERMLPGCLWSTYSSSARLHPREEIVSTLGSLTFKLETLWARELLPLHPDLLSSSILSYLLSEVCQSESSKSLVEVNQAIL